MNKIEIRVEYAFYPIYVFDENDEEGIPYADVPEGYESDVELVSLADKIQDIYNGLFINNKHEFSYKGFQTETEKKEFVKLLEELADMLERKVGHEYYIDRSALEEFQ